jgi:hypothetical protein
LWFKIFVSGCHVVGQAHGGAVFRGTALQAGKSWVPFPMVSLEFFIDKILLATMWPGVDPSCNKNEYKEYFVGGKGGQCIGLTTLPPSCTDCLEIYEHQPSETLRACTGIA